MQRCEGLLANRVRCCRRSSQALGSKVFCKSCYAKAHREGLALCSRRTKDAEQLLEFWRQEVSRERKRAEREAERKRKDEERLRIRAKKAAARLATKKAREEQQLRREKRARIAAKNAERARIRAEKRRVEEQRKREKATAHLDEIRRTGNLPRSRTTPRRDALVVECRRLLRLRPSLVAEPPRAPTVPAPVDVRPPGEQLSPAARRWLFRLSIAEDWRVSTNGHPTRSRAIIDDLYPATHSSYDCVEPKKLPRLFRWHGFDL